MLQTKIEGDDWLPAMTVSYNGKKLIANVRDKSFAIKAKEHNDPAKTLFLQIMGLKHQHLDDWQDVLQTFRDNIKRVYVHI